MCFIQIQAVRKNVFCIHILKVLPFSETNYTTVLKFIVQQMSTPDTRFTSTCFSNVTNEKDAIRSVHVLTLHACACKYCKVPQLT
jgi:hypothetical protein